MFFNVFSVRLATVLVQGHYTFHIFRIVRWPLWGSDNNPSFSIVFFSVQKMSQLQLWIFSSHSHSLSCHTVFLSSHFLTLFSTLYTQHTHTHTHNYPTVSLPLSLMSATEVTVWVFYPQATQPRFTMTVTPALPATLNPELLGSFGCRLTMTTGRR